MSITKKSTVTHGTEFPNRTVCVDEKLISSFTQAAQQIKPYYDFSQFQNLRIQEVPNNGIELQANYFGKNSNRKKSRHYQLTLTVCDYNEEGRAE